MYDFKAILFSKTSNKSNNSTFDMGAITYCTPLNTKLNPKTSYFAYVFVYQPRFRMMNKHLYGAQLLSLKTVVFSQLFKYIELLYFNECLVAQLCGTITHILRHQTRDSMQILNAALRYMFVVHDFVY